MLIDHLNVRIIHAATGEIIRTLTIDPNRRYHPTGKPRHPPRPPEKQNNPNPDGGPSCPRCLATSHRGRGGT
jgi:hypothetical protein